MKPGLECGTIAVEPSGLRQNPPDDGVVNCAANSSRVHALANGLPKVAS